MVRSYAKWKTFFFGEPSSLASSTSCFSVSCSTSLGGASASWEEVTSNCSVFSSTKRMFSMGRCVASHGSWVMRVSSAARRSRSNSSRWVPSSARAIQ